MTDVTDPMASRKNCVAVSAPAPRSATSAAETPTDSPGAGGLPAGRGAVPGPDSVPGPDPVDEIEEPDEYDDEAWKAIRNEPRPIPEVPADEILARAVAALLTGYRRYHRLTQQELAERMHVDQGELSRLERGQRTPTLRTLARIAAETGSRFTIDVEGPAGGVGAGQHKTATTVGGCRATVTVIGPTASVRPRRRPDEIRRSPWSSADLVGSRS